MPSYHRLGQIPHKRHTQFRQPDGSLYHEEVVGSEGFHGISSILYHLRPPTAIAQIGEPVPYGPTVIPTPGKSLRPRHLQGFKAEPGGDYLASRKMLLVNQDVGMGVALPTDGMDMFYKSADGSELIFVHEGSGVLDSVFGSLPFEPGDYLNIPRAIIHRFRFDEAGGQPRLLVIESASPIMPPRRYHNEFGQLLEHSPYCERDLRLPSELNTCDETGEFEVMVKKGGYLHRFVYNHHPFDVVGWDGYFYPYAFNVRDFEPITGRIHQPPPVHQTFEGHNFVVCSFVPRMFDYHPQAIPAPYNHSNIDSDEVLYYVEGNFMSRKGIEVGSLTLHPGGIPHGPHPGTYEGSIGKKETHELAVMLDTFHPLNMTTNALPLDDPDYAFSWLKPHAVADTVAG